MLLLLLPLVLLLQLLFLLPQLVLLLQLRLLLYGWHAVGCSGGARRGKLPISCESSFFIGRAHCELLLLLHACIVPVPWRLACV